MLESVVRRETEIRRPGCVDTSSPRPVQACSAVRALASVRAVVAALGCRSKPGDTCRAGTSTCMDRTTELACQAGRYIAAPCRGPEGCSEKASVVTCDVAANVTGDVCSTDDEGKG